MRTAYLLLLNWMAATCLTAAAPSELTDYPPSADETEEEQSRVFETLKVGGHTYTNAVVYRRTEEVIFVKHDGGLIGLRLDQMDDVALMRLGHEEHLSTSGFSLEKLLAQVLGRSANANSGGVSAFGINNIDPAVLTSLGTAALLISMAIGLALHLLFSYLFRVICIKAKSEPGFIIWLPFFQIFPILRAARMSAVWPFGILGLSILGALITGVSIEMGMLLSLSSSLLSLALWILWSFRICTAREKSPALAILLLLPGLNLFGLLYLAASR